MKQTQLLFCFSLMLLSIGKLQAQNNKTLDQVLNTLVQELEANPENPLNIDQTFLNNLSQRISDTSLKATLQYYGNNLEADQDLSYRQIYWDIVSAFNQNPSLLKDNSMAQINLQLSAIFNNSEQLNEKLKNLPQEKRFGAFVDDPSTFQGLQTLTGSYEDAVRINSSLDMVATLVQENKINKANIEKLKNDYAKTAKISRQVLYHEPDTNTAKCLIDAYLGMWPYRMFTPLYRYDFSNGSMLVVENSILKLRIPSKGISMNLALVDRRNKGKYAGIGRQDQYSSRYTPPLIMISSDEKYIYLTSFADRGLSDGQCPDCLGSKNSFSGILSSETGEVLFQENKVSDYITWGKHFNSRFGDEGTVEYFSYNTAPVDKGIKKTYTKGVNHSVQRIEKKGDLDLSKSFIFNGAAYSFKKTNPFAALSNDPVKYSSIYEKDNSTFGLFWATSDNYCSSMLQVVTGKEPFTCEGMTNKLTGLVMTKKGDLFFTGANGSVGTIKADRYNPTNNLAGEIMKALEKNNLPAYDFICTKNYFAQMGSTVYNTATQECETSSAPPVLPSLLFTPDEKYLIYLLKDSLFLIDTSNLKAIKRFGLSFQPYASFYTKENNALVINLMGMDDLMYPIVKKYAISKFITVDTKKKSNSPFATVNPAKSNHQASGTSVADELKKLKELMDQGVLTQEEFNTEKKRLLNQGQNSASSGSTTGANNTATSAAGKNTGAQNGASTKQCDGLQTFAIKGKTYYGTHWKLDDFIGTYNYMFTEIRTWNGKPEEPIVILNKDFTGTFQFHEPARHPIEWWIECDANCNPIILQGEDFLNYTLIVRFKDGVQNDDRMALNYRKGIEVVILGERVKKLSK